MRYDDQFNKRSKVAGNKSVNKGRGRDEKYQNVPYVKLNQHTLQNNTFLQNEFELTRFSVSYVIINLC